MVRAAARLTPEGRWVLVPRVVLTGRPVAVAVPRGYGESLMEMPAEIRRIIVAHALSCLPDEACGLLAADDAGRIRAAYCLRNAASSPTAYTLDPEEHYRALREAEARGWRLAGVFHSHPRGTAHPSATDLAQAPEPDWLYVVVGLLSPAAPEVRGFWIREGKAEEEGLVEPEAAVIEVRR